MANYSHSGVITPETIPNVFDRTDDNGTLVPAQCFTVTDEWSAVDPCTVQFLTRSAADWVLCMRDGAWRRKGHR